MADNREKPLPPGTMGLPIIGETHQFLRRENGFYEEKNKEYGNVFKTKILCSPTVIIAGAENIKNVTGREYDHLEFSLPKSKQLILGPKSILLVEGQEHATLKQQMLKAFTPSRISKYFPIVQRHIQTHLQKWIDLGEKGHQIIGYNSCTRLADAINLEVVIGFREEEDRDGKMFEALRDACDKSLSVPIKFPFSDFLKASNAREMIHDFVKSRISQKGDDDCVSIVDFLVSLYRGQEGHIDEEKVKDNALCLLTAGSATLTSELMGLIFILGTHPEVVEKVKEELKQAGIGQDTELTYDIVKKLKYVDSVVKELLRCLPPVSTGFRKTSTELEIDGYRIPKDWTVVYNLKSTHDQASNQLPNGDTFDPSRWMMINKDQERGSSSENPTPPLDWNSCPFIPFGSGPRRCVGSSLAWMVMQMLVVEISRKAKCSVINPDCPLSVYSRGFTKPKDNLPCIFKRLEL